eukprot:GILI01027132.1.p1 GENE.GILI01027132.1~~GILI01027132.1.p1  ORF type:complete len:106 (+),score=16.17 GILI01027132.1:45-362(+)
MTIDSIRVANLVLELAETRQTLADYQRRLADANSCNEVLAQRVAGLESEAERLRSENTDLRGRVHEMMAVNQSSVSQATDVSQVSTQANDIAALQMIVRKANLCR